ncbi:MAG: tol-pal system protein YbgF [Rubrivivax sp.]|nr:tol-pal system protein YbgF [Rubrivivax sp.]MDP3225384.1 tol-pal system protein YbgF [Rubrivivax sp.]
MRLRGWPALAAVYVGLTSGAAHAFLNDEEARKAIVELRARITTMEDQGKSRATELSAATAQNAQLTEQLAALRRSLLDLNNQLEAMRGEIAKLRGNDEQALREIADIQRRQRDVTQALEERLRQMEPVKVSLDGRDFTVGPEEKRAFDEAFAAIRGGNFDKSVALLSNFMRRYPGSPYTDAARFWLGNSLYGRRDYKEAISVFRGFVTEAPEHPRAPEALLAVANSQAEMKDPRSARRTIDELMKAYPQSEAAQAGKDRLASIK